MDERTRVAADVVVAFDVDGVLLDPTRGGRGPWAEELRARHGIEPAALSAAFFERYWSEIVVGELAVEPALGTALGELGSDAGTEDVLRCWFDADFHVDRDVLDQARSWADLGVRVVLATNQEHRRAAYLEERFAGLLPVHAMVYSAQVGFAKPDPRFFAAVGERLGIPQGAVPVVLIDDDPANVAQARRCGWIGVHFDGRDTWRGQVHAALATGHG